MPVLLVPTPFFGLRPLEKRLTPPKIRGRTDQLWPALFRKSLFGAGLESTEAVDLCLKVQIVFPMRYGNGNQERRTDSSDAR